MFLVDCKTETYNYNSETIFIRLIDTENQGCLKFLKTLYKLILF